MWAVKPSQAQTAINMETRNPPGWDADSKKGGKKKCV